MNLSIRYLGAALGAVLFATQANAAPTQLFALDFEGAPIVGPISGYTGDAAGGVIDPGQDLPGFGTAYFHNATSGLSTLTLSGLGAHSSLTLSFDVAFIDTWDGNDDPMDSDYLFVTVDGAPLFELSSNHWLSGMAPQYQGGTLVGIGDYYRDLGSDDDYNYPDAVVRYNGLASLTFAHTASTFTLGFQAGGGNWQGDGNSFDESYGIDNLVISANAVPEPATWAMMLIGFGVSGALLRRRRFAMA